MVLYALEKRSEVLSALWNRSMVVLYAGVEGINVVVLLTAVGGLHFIRD